MRDHGNPLSGKVSGPEAFIDRLHQIMRIMGFTPGAIGIVKIDRQLCFGG